MMPRLLPLLLLLSACAAPGRTIDTDTGHLKTHAELDYTSPEPDEGELGVFMVRIRNVSKKFVVLRDMIQPGGGPMISWEVAPAKPLVFDSARDEYRLDTDPKAAAAASVNMGFLLPGEEIQFRPQIRFLNFPRTCTIQYFAYTSDEAARNVYFEEKKDRVVRYRKSVAGDLDKLRPAGSTEGSHRTVVFPHAHSILDKAKTADIAFNIRLIPRSFRFADALAKLNIKAADVSEHTFCSSYKAWAIRTRTAGWLVADRGNSPLPFITRFELFFQHIDTMDTQMQVQVEFLKECDALFPRIKIVPLREGSRVRKIGFVPRSDVIVFLKEVQENGLEIDVKTEGRQVLVFVTRPL